MNKVKFASLDAIRGIAAIFVVTRHTGEYFGGYPFFNSFLAVDIFFLLSGFVIAHAYGKKLLSNTISNTDFFKIRLIRLYPMFILSLVLSICITLYESNHIEKNLESIFLQALLSAFFIPNFIPPLAMLFPLNPVFWSLFYELTINMFMSFFRSFLNDKIIITSLISSAIILIFFAFRSGSIDSGFTWDISSIAIGSCRAFFGIIFGFYLYKFNGKIKSPRWLSQSSFFPLTLIGLILATPDLGSLNWVFQLSVVFVIFPACMILAAQSKQGAITTKIMIFLGLVSYPIYVLHVPLSHLGLLIFPDWIKSYAPYSGLSFLLILIVVSAVIETYYEKKSVLSLKKRFIYEKKMLPSN